MLEEVPSTPPPPTRRASLRAALWAAACALFAFEAAPPAWARSDAQELQIEFDAPHAPGDSFALALAVPQHHFVGVLLVDPAKLGSGAIAGAPTSAEIAAGLFVPVPLAPGDTTALLTGVVPPSMTTQQMLASSLVLRVLLVDLQTLVPSWSEPIVLRAEASPAADAAASPAGAGAIGKSGPSSSMQVQSITSTQLAVTAPTSGAANLAPTSNAFPSAQQGSPPSGANSKKSNGPMSVRMQYAGTGFFHDGSHDQPVPVQGSGH